MSQSKVIKNYLYNTAYQLLVLLAPLITTPYVSRVLGATGIGIYSYAQSIATYFVLIGAVGTALYGQREIAYAQDKESRTKVFWEITLFRFISVAVCTAVYLAAFGFGRQYSDVYRILTIEVVATAFDISWFFMGIENFRLTVIRNSIIKFVGIVLVFVFVKGAGDVGIYTACLTVPILIGNISLWISLPKYLSKTKIRARGIVRHIKPTLVLFVPQLATEIYVVLDKTMLGALSSNINEVGYYTQASKIVKIVLMLVTSLGTVMLPAMSAAFAKGEKEVIKSSIRKAFRFVFMLGFALLFGLCGIAKNFVPLFFGAGYDKVVYLMMGISPILIFIAMSNVMGKQYLLPTHQEKAYTSSVVTGAAVNFVLNALLIPKFDAAGATIATVIAEFSVTAVQAWWVHKQIHIWKCIAPGVKYLILGAVMGTIVYGTGELLGGGFVAVVIQILVGVVVYALELIITKDAMLKEGLALVKKKGAKHV